MPALFQQLEQETEPDVWAVLGHLADRNGRMAWFVMNAILASGGYPWILIRVEGRVRLELRLISPRLETRTASNDPY